MSDAVEASTPKQTKTILIVGLIVALVVVAGIVLISLHAFSSHSTAGGGGGGGGGKSNTSGGGHGIPNVVKVELTAGTVEGRVIDVPGLPSTKVRAFLGVPFAQSTAGARRFANPVTITEYPNRHVDATTPRGGCVETPSYTVASRSAPTTEDCLHSSIWSPLDAKGKAVVVLISNEYFEERQDPALLDGAHLAVLGDVVVVVPNHRLGAFGFLTTSVTPREWLEAMGLQPPNGTVMDAAMYDVLEALNWVKENISPFGGNKEQVTIVAHGAASHMTARLLRTTYPKLSGVTKKVVLLGMGYPVKLPENNINSTWNLAKALPAKCNSTSVEGILGCLRGAPAEDIAKAVQAMKRPMRFVPTLTGRDGELPGIKILAGSAVNDADNLIDSRIVPYVKRRKNNLTLEATLDQLFKIFLPSLPISASDVTSMLPSNYDLKAPGYRALKDIVSDFLFRCPLLEMLDKVQSLKAEVQHYILMYKPKSSKWPSPGATILDQLLLLSGAPFQDKANAGDDDIAMSRKLIKMIATFAKDGTVADVGGIKWPFYDEDAQTSLLIDVNKVEVKNGWHTNTCAFFHLVQLMG